MERLSEPNQGIVARGGALLIGHGDSGMKAEPAGTVVLHLPARCRSCSERGMTPFGFKQCVIFTGLPALGVDFPVLPEK